MLCFPNAKINLGLHVTEKRSDSYHNIETVFYPIPLCDALEFAEIDSKEAYRFSSSGIALDVNVSENIIVKTFKHLASIYQIPPTAIHLHKKIPFGAGLGGGSSDAAYAIKLLNDLYNLKLSFKSMEKLALEMGSDCPFFIRNQAVFAEGKGEVFSPVRLNLKGYFLVLIKPDIHVSTAEAYRGIKPHCPQLHLQELIQRPVSEWKEFVVNDFEKSVFQLHPELQNIKNELYQLGALYAAMSGSGSCMFGIFDSEVLVPTRNNHDFVWVGKL